jgi:hypothetical protein
LFQVNRVTHAPWPFDSFSTLVYRREPVASAKAMYAASRKCSEKLLAARRIDPLTSNQLSKSARQFLVRPVRDYQRVVALNGPLMRSSTTTDASIQSS